MKLILTTLSKIRLNYLVVLTGPYNVNLITPHFYIIKLELAGVHIISFFALKHRWLVLVLKEAFLMCTHNLCFEQK